MLMEVFSGCFSGHQEKRNRLTQDVWSLRQKLKGSSNIDEYSSTDTTTVALSKSLNAKNKGKTKLSSRSNRRLRDHCEHSEDSNDSGAPLLYNRTINSTDESEISNGSSQSKSGMQY